MGLWSTHCSGCWSCDPGIRRRGSQHRLAWRPRCAPSSGCRHTRCWGRSWGCSETGCSLHCWDWTQPGWGLGNTICTSTWQQGAEWPSSGICSWGWRAGRGWRCTSWWGTGPRWPWQSLGRDGGELDNQAWMLDDGYYDWLNPSF